MVFHFNLCVILQVRRKINETQEEFHVVYAALGKEPVTIQVKYLWCMPPCYH
jgi:hypothetical protein